MTLSPVKTAWDELRQIVAAEPDRVARIMVNTDSGSSFFEDAVRYRHDQALPDDIRGILFQGAAGRFFELSDGRR